MSSKVLQFPSPERRQFLRVGILAAIENATHKVLREHATEGKEKVVSISIGKRQGVA